MTVQTAVAVDVRWRAAAPVSMEDRERLVEELQQLAWTLARLEEVAYEADRIAGDEHAFLVPRIEARIPWFDRKVCYRVVFRHNDGSLVRVVDEAGRTVADLTIA